MNTMREIEARLRALAAAAALAATALAATALPADAADPAAGLSETAAEPAAARPEKKSYDRYKSIVERQMFGPLPEDFDPTKLPSDVSRTSAAAAGKAAVQLTKEQAKLKKAVRFSVINVTPPPQNDVAVGFTDSSEAKNPKHYYLRVGETRDGWFVKAADPETATMTIVKDEIELTLSIGGDSTKDDPRKGAAANPANAGANPKRAGLLNRGIMSRRQQRQAEMNQVMASNEQLLEKMEEIQREREQERLEQEEREAKEKAEMDANRNADKKELNDLRKMMMGNRAKLTAPAPEEKPEEGSGSEDNDSE